METSQLSQSDMLDKVRKLLSKAEGTNNEIEANTFFAKAQELMEKYAISEAEARAAGHTHSQTKPIQTTINLPKGHVTITNAHITLITTISRCNRCVAYYFNNDTSNWMIAGFESDVRFVEMLYHSIIVQMDQNMLKAFFDGDAQAANTVNHNSFKDAAVKSETAKNAVKQAAKRTFRPEFIAGYVERITQRIVENEKMREQDRTVSTALVLRNSVHDVRNWLTDEMGLKFTAGRSRSLGNFARNDFARNAGRNAANNADIGNPSVQNTTKYLN